MLPDPTKASAIRGKTKLLGAKLVYSAGFHLIQESSVLQIGQPVGPAGNKVIGQWFVAAVRSDLYKLIILTLTVLTLVIILVVLAIIFLVPKIFHLIFSVLFK